jgi:hypothetical protein
MPGDKRVSVHRVLDGRHGRAASSTLVNYFDPVVESVMAFFSPGPRRASALNVLVGTSLTAVAGFCLGALVILLVSTY